MATNEGSKREVDPLAEVVFQVAVRHIQTVQLSFGSKTEYTLQIKSDVENECWEFRKAFSDFVEFERLIKTNPMFKNLKIPELRKQSAWTTSSDELLETRKKSLEKWLREFLNRNLFASCQEARTFLEIGPKTKKQLAQIAEVQEIPLHAGEMMKRGEVVKTWRRRYFTLHSNWVLRYYDQEGSKIPRGNVDITEVNKIVSYEADPDHPFSFSMNTKRRTWLFKCDSKEKLNEWIQHITHLMQSTGKYRIHVHAGEDGSVGKFESDPANLMKEKNRLSTEDSQKDIITPEEVLNDSDVDIADATLEDQAREIRRLKNILKSKNDELEELKSEFDEERRRLMEKLGASDVKKRLSSFREQISHQDTRLAECMAEMAQIEETMRAETQKYKDEAEQSEKAKAETEQQNQELQAEIDRIKNENKLLQSKNPKIAKDFYAKEVGKLREAGREKDDKIESLIEELKKSQEETARKEKRISELELLLEEEVPGASKTKRETIPSARKMSAAIPPSELGPDRPTSFALSDTLFKFGDQGARRAKKKFVWFVHASGHSYIEWSDTQDAKSSKRATVMKISLENTFVKRELTDEEHRRIFVIFDNTNKKLVFLAGSEQKRGKWYNGISKFVEIVS